jgi:hypothetical protein
MRRNYRPNNRPYYRPGNENQAAESMKDVTDPGMNIPSNTEGVPNIDQNKEDTLINTAETNLDNDIDNNTKKNNKNNSTQEITDSDISKMMADVISDTTPEKIKETMSDTTLEVTKETIPDTTPEVTKETKPNTTSEETKEIISDTTSEFIKETIQDTIPKAIEKAISETTPETIANTIPEAAESEVEDLELTLDDIIEQKEDTLEIQMQKEILSDSDRDIIIINKERYEILASEHSYVFHPEYFGISPTWTNDSNFRYKCLFELEDHQLYLKSFQVTCDRGYPIINSVKPEVCNLEHGFETVQYININEPMEYSGAIMFANSLVKDYRLPYHMDLYNPPCFSYKFVGELIFDEGKLITSVNHNKAMRRIRKNIDLGLRSLDKKQDINCIKKFIKVSFIGDYQYQKKKQKGIWKDTSKSKNVKNKDVHIMESGKITYLDKIKQNLRKLGSK